MDIQIVDYVALTAGIIALIVFIVGVISIYGDHKIGLGEFWFSFFVFGLLLIATAISFDLAFGITSKGSDNLPDCDVVDIDGVDYVPVDCLELDNESEAE